MCRWIAARCISSICLEPTHAVPAEGLVHRHVGRGTHTVQISWDKNTSAGAAIDVDAFDVLGILPSMTDVTALRIMWAEQKLVDLSYRPGPIDGVIDRQTRGAVIAFQKWEGLSRNGKLERDGLRPATDRDPAHAQASRAPAALDRGGQGQAVAALLQGRGGGLDHAGIHRKSDRGFRDALRDVPDPPQDPGDQSALAPAVPACPRVSGHPRISQRPHAAAPATVASARRSGISASCIR